MVVYKDYIDCLLEDEAAKFKETNKLLTSQELNKVYYMAVMQSVSHIRCFD